MGKKPDVSTFIASELQWILVHRGLSRSEHALFPHIDHVLLYPARATMSELYPAWDTFEFILRPCDRLSANGSWH